ncbi:MAG: DeoR/GlpR family DNA-binding transcription regulator [Actinomycetales bacterium]
MASRQRERQRAIAAAVTEAGSIRIEELAERFDISVMTVHRDLDDLAARGLLHKSRGMATAVPTSMLEASFDYRRSRQQQEKAEIARAAIHFVEPNQTLLLEDSTTTLALAELLRPITPLTVATNYLPIITTLAEVRGHTLLALGGQYHDWANAFLGGMTIQMVERLHVDLLVMSTSAVFDGHCYHQAQETVETKRAMLGVAQRSILLVDHTKFARRALHRLCPLTDFDVVVVDSRVDQATLDELGDLGVAVRVASRLT